MASKTPWVVEAMGGIWDADCHYLGRLSKREDTIAAVDSVNALAGIAPSKLKGFVESTERLYLAADPMLGLRQRLTPMQEKELGESLEVYRVALRDLMGEVAAKEGGA